MFVYPIFFVYICTMKNIKKIIDGEEIEIEIMFKETPMCEHCGDGHTYFGVEFADLNGGISWCYTCGGHYQFELTDEEMKAIKKEEVKQTIKFHKRKIKKLEKN